MQDQRAIVEPASRAQEKRAKMSAQSDKAPVNTIPQLIAGKWQPAAESYDVRGYQGQRYRA